MASSSNIRHCCYYCGSELCRQDPSAPYDDEQFLSVDQMRANNTPCNNYSCPVYVDWDHLPAGSSYAAQDGQSTKPTRTASQAQDSQVGPKADSDDALIDNAKVPRATSTPIRTRETRNAFTQAEIDSINAWRSQGHSWAYMESMMNGRHTRRSIESKWRDMNSMRDR